FRQNRRTVLNRQKLVSLGGAAVLIVTMLPSGLGRDAASAAPKAQAPNGPPDTTAFQNLWDRTDSLVASSRVKRSWFWGPQAFWTTREIYVDDPTGTQS